MPSFISLLDSSSTAVRGSWQPRYRLASWISWIISDCNQSETSSPWGISTSGSIQTSSGSLGTSSILLAPKELYTWYCPMTIRPLFENTPVLDNNLNIDALMTLTMMNKITRNVKWHKISNGTKCQMTQNVKWHKVSNDTKCQMTQNIKWHKISNDTKYQISKYHSSPGRPFFDI